MFCGKSFVLLAFPLSLVSVRTYTLCTWCKEHYHYQDYQNFGTSGAITASHHRHKNNDLSLGGYVLLRTTIYSNYMDLHIFRLKNCGKTVTNDGILSERPSMPNLFIVEITHCRSVMYEMLSPLPSLCENLCSVTFESHYCFDCSRLKQSKYPELDSHILRKLYSRVTYWHVVC